MKIVRVLLSFLLLAASAGAAAAEDWPTRRLRIVVPFPAGGSGDVQVRIVADELAKALGSRSSWKTSQGGAAPLPPWMSPRRRPTVIR
jgi:tripartite-type tricarboxylate transporter receptor subunit TctC